MKETSHWAAVASLTASLVINSAVFLSVDRAVTQGTLSPRLFFMPKESSKKEIIQLDFVEAPPTPAEEKPKKTLKVAARDSKASDLTQGPKKDSSPKIQAGQSDQLSQRPSKGTPVPPASAVSPSQPTPEDLLPSFKKPNAPYAPTTPKPKASGPETPKGPDAWMPGKGKILTQEMAKAKSKGAKFYGVTSFEATGSGMGVYMERLKEKIWTHWFPYVAFKFPRDFRGADAVIRFKLDASGKVLSARVVESKGTPLFAVFCMEAVERAGNFGTLPKEILVLTGKEELEINFGFHYG